MKQMARELTVPSRTFRYCRQKESTHGRKQSPTTTTHTIEHMHRGVFTQSHTLPCLTLQPVLDVVTTLQPPGSVLMVLSMSGPMCVWPSGPS